MDDLNIKKIVEKLIDTFLYAGQTSINLRNKGIKVLEEDKDSVLVDVCSGENWNDFVLWAIDNNYGGIENLSLIPGNVGAAPIQNIGAYGVELKDVFYSASGIMLDSLRNFELNTSECKFSYRNSIFKNELKDKVIITSIKLKLTKGNHNYNIEIKVIEDGKHILDTGGGILKEDILNCESKFIHFHPGIVPNYRGSTCFYYSMINENQCGVTAFFMDKHLDTGKIILQKTFDSPNHEFVDNVYDPYIRSETLVEVLKNNYLISKNLKEQSSEGETYYIIHPVLKHIAILSCLND